MDSCNMTLSATTGDVVDADHVGPRKTFPPPAPEEIADRLWVCRKNICGEYVRNRGTGGKEQELCYCTTTCQGKPTPIEKLCKRAPECPGGGHW